ISTGRSIASRRSCAGSTARAGVRVLPKFAGGRNCRPASVHSRESGNPGASDSDPGSPLSRGRTEEGVLRVARLTKGKTEMTMHNITTARFLMCRPEHFAVSYTINPWMNPTRWARDAGAHAAAEREWAGLHGKLLELGAA